MLFQALRDLPPCLQHEHGQVGSQLAVIVRQDLLIGLGMLTGWAYLRGILALNYIAAIMAMPGYGLGTLEHGAVLDMLSLTCSR
jgi:hypothetical protein